MIKRLLLLTTCAALATACNSGSKGSAQDTGYAADADTGAASPGASYSPQGAPDSNTAKSTGQGSAAGTRSNGTDIGPPQGTNPGTPRP